MKKVVKFGGSSKKLGILSKVRRADAMWYRLHRVRDIPETQR